MSLFLVFIMLVFSGMLTPVKAAAGGGDICNNPSNPVIIQLCDLIQQLKQQVEVLTDPGSMSLLTDPGLDNGGIYLAPPIYDKTLYGPVGFFGVTPRWHIAQWGIQEPLPKEKISLKRGSWKVENRHAAVTYQKSGTYILKQDSRNLDTGCGWPGSEFDLLLEPNEARAYPGYPEGFILEGERPYLADMKSLHVMFTSRLRIAGHGKRCGEHKNLASSLVGIVFHSDKKNHGLFYQIVTYDSRTMSFSSSWFDKNAPYGVSDSVEVFGYPPLVVGGAAQVYTLDIADRVKDHIQNGPLGIDKDLSNWRVFGIYFGSYTNGEGWITTEYKDVDLQATGF